MAVGRLWVVLLFSDRRTPRAHEELTANVFVPRHLHYRRAV